MSGQFWSHENGPHVPIYWGQLGPARRKFGGPKKSHGKTYRAFLLLAKVIFYTACPLNESYL